MAHGEAGVAYALLLWQSTTGCAESRRLTSALAKLQAIGESLTRFPSDSGALPAYVRASWCQGVSGLTHAYCLAHRVTGDPRWLALGEKAADLAWSVSGAGANLCCGLAGRAYALARFAAGSGERRWLDRAKELAANAYRSVDLTHHSGPSLFRGGLGVALVVHDLAETGGAEMPVLE